MNQADFVEFPYLSDLSDFTDLTVALNKQDSEETSSQTDNEKEECLDVKIENALKKLK